MLLDVSCLRQETQMRLDGLHVGQDLNRVRKLTGGVDGFVLFLSAHDEEAAGRAQRIG